MKRIKLNLGFRIHRYNRLTIPVLLNQIERARLDQEFHIYLLKNQADVNRFVKKTSYGLLAYSFMTPQLPFVRSEVQWIATIKKPDVKIVAGGPHTAGDPYSALKTGFDYAYCGPAESGFIHFLRSFLDSYVFKSRLIFRAPDLSDLDTSLPVSKIFPVTPPLEITRGCPWTCKFCQTSCYKSLHRSMNSIKKVYSLYKEKNHHRRISFICPSAFEFASKDANRLNFEAIAELLAYCKSQGTQHLEFGIFPSEVRADTVTEKFVNLIGKYCSNRKLTIGGQSGSERMLKIIRRGHSLENIEQACQIVHGKKFIPLVDIILGFPGETRDDRHQTLRFVKKMSTLYRARIHVHHFIPLSGTAFERVLPTALDYKTIDTLQEFEKSGICTGWWKEGMNVANEVIRTYRELDKLHIPQGEIFSLSA